MTDAAYPPEQESVREICANLAMTFRFNANAHAVITPAEFQNWALRLERAVQRLDAETLQRKLESFKPGDID